MEHDDVETFSENLLALYFVWIVSDIRLHSKCLLLGWPRHGGKNYCCNIYAL